MAEINTGGGENFKAPLTPNERAEKANSDPNQKTLDGNFSGQKTFGGDYLGELKSNALKNEFITKFRSEQGKDTNTPGNPEIKIEVTPVNNPTSADTETSNLPDVPNAEAVSDMLRGQRKDINEPIKTETAEDNKWKDKAREDIKANYPDKKDDEIDNLINIIDGARKSASNTGNATGEQEKKKTEPAPGDNSVGVTPSSVDGVKNETGVKAGDNPTGVKTDAAPGAGSNETNPEGKPTEAKTEPAPGETRKETKDEKTDPNGGNTETSTGSGSNEKKQDKKSADETKTQEGVKKDEAGKEVSGGWKGILKDKLKDFVGFFDPRGKDREWYAGVVVGGLATGGATLTGGTIPLNIITTAAAGGILWGGEKLIYSLKERKIKKLEKTNADEYAEKMKQLEDGHAKGVMRIQKFMKGLAAGAVVGGLGGIALDAARDAVLVNGIKGWDVIKAPQHGFEQLRSGVDQLGQTIKEGLSQSNIDNINYSIGETGKEISRTIMEKTDLVNVEMKRIWEIGLGVGGGYGGIKVLEGLAKKIRGGGEVKT